jgi:hypothetical protein
VRLVLRALQSREAENAACQTNITGGGRYCYNLPKNACPGNNACFNYTCNPSGAGSCDPTALPCSTLDVCLDAVCVLTGATPGCATQAKSSTVIASYCSDSDACTIDSCTIGGAGCQHDPSPRTSCAARSDNCTTYQCNNGTGFCNIVFQRACDDGNSCTTDTCNPQVNGGCVYTNVSQTAVDARCQPTACQIATCVNR